MAHSSNIAQQREKDAYEFALLLYDIYKEEQANSNADSSLEQEVEKEPCQNPLLP